MKAFEIASQIKPTERQLKWMDMEYYAIVYYGMNTFTGKEIGDGFAVPETFCPENIDTDEWAKAVSDGYMSGLVLTARHYDGFCNWQTETTDYSVKSSNWLEGKGDLVKMVAASARKHGLKFGLYIPVWDRHEPSFKENDDSYNKFFLTQIKELVTSYGELFTLWLDDRCDDLMPYIDYEAIYSLVREHQPDCAIVFRGPDGRWLGNGRGVLRKSEWSVVPASYTYNEDGTIPRSVIKPKHGQMETDIGSRKFIKKETEFRFAPCEVSIPMRPHWFHKKDDDMIAKTKDKLLTWYYKTVGANMNLMLGIAPDKRGRLYEQDLQILESTGHEMKVIFGYNILKDPCKITASSELSALYKVSNIADENDSFWSPSEKDKKPEIVIEFDEPQMFDKVVIKENIRNGQKIEEFEVYIDVKGKWKSFGEGTVIGHKAICHTKPVETTRVKIKIKEFRATPEILYVQIN